jgi:hypothetical protein
MSAQFKQWLVVSVLIAVAIVALAPVPTRLAKGTGANNEGWSVPRIEPADAQTPALVTSLQRSALWGGQADLAATDSRASQWRIAGITGSARDRVVLVQFGDDRILPLKVGEKFPDGTPIVEIRETGVCVTLSEKRRFLPLAGQTIPIVW